MCRSKIDALQALKFLEEEADVLGPLVKNTDDDFTVSGARLKDKGLSPKEVSKTIYKTAQRGCGSLSKDTVYYDGSRIHVGSQVRRAILSVCKAVGYPTS